MRPSTRTRHHPCPRRLTRRLGLAERQPDAHTNPFADSHSLANTFTFSFTDAFANTKPDADTYSGIYTGTYPDALTDADACAFAGAGRAARRQPNLRRRWERRRGFEKRFRGNF